MKYFRLDKPSRLVAQLVLAIITAAVLIATVIPAAGTAAEGATGDIKITLNTGVGEPDIWVEPPGFDVTLPREATWDGTLRIGNSGTDILTYSITNTETTSMYMSCPWLDENPKSGSVDPGIFSPDQAQEAATYGFGFDETAIRWQEFQPERTWLSKIDTYISKVGNPGNLRVAVKDTGENVLWETTVAEGEIGLGGWVEIAATPSVQLVPDNSYYIHVWSDASSPSPDNRYSWMGQPDSGYDRGVSSVEGSLPGYDFAFRTWSSGYDEITVSIDTQTLAVGDYSAEVEISNNDPDENPTIVPVNLTVVEAMITGSAGEVNCDNLPSTKVEAYKDAVLEASATSAGDGNYTLPLREPGDYDMVASKTGYKDATQPISITAPEEYTLDFIGEHGLIPSAPDMSYVLGCVNNWLYPASPCGLSMSKVLEVINAWLYPT